MHPTLEPRDDAQKRRFLAHPATRCPFRALVPCFRTPATQAPSKSRLPLSHSKPQKSVVARKVRTSEGRTRTTGWSSCGCWFIQVLLVGCIPCC